MLVATIFFFTEIPWKLRKNYLDKSAQKGNSSTLVQEIGESKEDFVKRQHVHQQEQASLEQQRKLSEAAWKERYKVFVWGGQNIGNLSEDEKKLLTNKKPNICGIIVTLWIFLVHFNGFAA